ncbi:SulP family inorganic anion transporter, partial [Tenacibaculum finnmarkense]|nr:SulP family inorganic anion transporter [Tenacibaculum finnmarkense]
MKTQKLKQIPADGWAGFKENFKADAISGFIVFLLALPLSLGIAKAADFPPIMGLISAIIGGLLVSFIMGSRLSIKGPAAGLIVIIAGSVSDFGHGDAVLG